MKFVDKFFTWIFNVQIFLENIEDWYMSKRKYMPKIYILAFMMAAILSLCKQVILAVSILISIMLIAGLENIVGWKHSVRRWLKVCVIYNFFFSLILFAIIQQKVNNIIIDMLFIIIYLLVWVFLSLISNSRVALLVNEIVSSMAATIFTIGTYIVSMERVDGKIEGLEILDSVFMACLPVIGVTTLCIIMIKIKGYWMEKYKISEPEKKIGYDEKSSETY